VDPVLDYDAASAQTAQRDTIKRAKTFVNRIIYKSISLLKRMSMPIISRVPKALSAQTAFPKAKTAIGEYVEVQKLFQQVFHSDEEHDNFYADARQFDMLLHDHQEFHQLGETTVQVLYTPGHLPRHAFPCALEMLSLLGMHTILT
jgi:hypothetical protein